MKFERGFRGNLGLENEKKGKKREKNAGVARKTRKRLDTKWGGQQQQQQHQKKRTKSNRRKKNNWDRVL